MAGLARVGWYEGGHGSVHGVALHSPMRDRMRIHPCGFACGSSAHDSSVWICPCAHTFSHWDPLVHITPTIVRSFPHQLAGRDDAALETLLLASTKTMLPTSDFFFAARASGRLSVVIGTVATLHALSVETMDESCMDRTVLGCDVLIKCVGFTPDKAFDKKVRADLSKGGRVASFHNANATVSMRRDSDYVNTCIPPHPRPPHHTHTRFASIGVTPPQPQPFCFCWCDSSCTPLPHRQFASVGVTPLPRPNPFASVGVTPAPRFLIHAGTSAHR